MIKHVKCDICGNRIPLKDIELGFATYKKTTSKRITSICILCTKERKNNPILYDQSNSIPQA